MPSSRPLSQPRPHSSRTTLSDPRPSSPALRGDEDEAERRCADKTVTSSLVPIGHAARQLMVAGRSSSGSGIVPGSSPGWAGGSRSGSVPGSGASCGVVVMASTVGTGTCAVVSPEGDGAGDAR